MVKLCGRAAGADDEEAPLTGAVVGVPVLALPVEMVSPSPSLPNGLVISAGTFTFFWEARRASNTGSSRVRISPSGMPTSTWSQFVLLEKILGAA